MVEEGNLLKTEGHTEYNYNDLLERVVKQLKDKNPSLQESGKLKQTEDPHVIKLGTTKTSWQNFGPMCTLLNRKLDHMMSFVAAELGVEATLGPEENMILQGKFQGKHIEKLYKNYLALYVRCNNCKGFLTVLEKDPSTRLYNLLCNQCNSTRSVA